MSLQAIQQETKIDKRIKLHVKRFLKENRQFKQVDQREGCDAIISFHRDDLTKNNIKLNDDKEPLYLRDRVTYVFTKNKKKHDTKLHTCSYIRDIAAQRWY